MYLNLLTILGCFIFIMSCSKPLETPNVLVTQQSEIVSKTQDTSTELDNIINLQQDMGPEIQNNSVGKQSCVVFDGFTDSQKNNWLIVNDGVMGGLSKGTYIIDNGVLSISGNINTNGGGFSSIRTGLSDGLLETATHIHISAKPDVRDYKITFRDNNRRGISHQADLVFKNTGGFENIVIPLSDLKPSYFGRNANAADFQKNQARELGFIISDGVDGPFQLEIESIRFCKE